LGAASPIACFGGTLTAVKVGRLTRIRREDAEPWAAKLHSYKSA
jgi:hypothetical protein